MTGATQAHTEVCNGDDEAERTALAARLAGTNINETTYLATDYLNHFNEIVMLLDMVPDMPDIFEDARAWQPKDYCAHFRDSAFSDKDLAVAAYELAPPTHRIPFDETITRMNDAIMGTLDRIEASIAAGDEQTVRQLATTTSRAVQKLIDVASAIIHGTTTTMEQDAIDALLES